MEKTQMLSQIGSNLDLRLMAVTMEICKIFSWYEAQTMASSYLWRTQVWKLTCAARKGQMLMKSINIPITAVHPYCGVHLAGESAGTGE